MAVFQVILKDIGENEETRAEVCSKIASVFKLSDAQVAKMTANLPKIVAKGLKKKIAERYVKTFAHIGASAEMRLAMEDAESADESDSEEVKQDPSLTHRQLILVSAGDDPDNQFKIRENLAQILEISKPQTILMTSENPCVLKRHLAPDKAENLAQELKREGAYIEIKPDTAPSSDPINYLEVTDSTREYVNQMINSGVSRKTIQQHLVILNAIKYFIGSSEISRISDDELRDFQSCAVKRLPEARDINLLRNILQSYFQFLSNEGQVDVSPILLSSQPKKDIELNPKLLELNSEEMLMLENSADEFQRKKPGLLKSLVPLKHESSGSSQNYSPSRLFSIMSKGLQSLILTIIGALIILIILKSVYSFGILNSSNSFKFYQEDLVRVEMYIVDDLNKLKKWYESHETLPNELLTVKNCFELDQLVKTTGIKTEISNIQKNYKLIFYNPEEKLFLFQDRQNSLKNVLLNLKLKEAYVINEGISKKLFSWQ